MALLTILLTLQYLSYSSQRLVCYYGLLHRPTNLGLRSYMSVDRGCCRERVRRPQASLACGLDVGFRFVRGRIGRVDWGCRSSVQP